MSNLELEQLNQAKQLAEECTLVELWRLFKKPNGKSLTVISLAIEIKMGAINV